MIDVAQDIKVGDFPSLNIVLEEIRLMFQYEQNRFRNIEDKTNSFLILNSIILMLVGSLLLAGNLLFLPTEILLLISIYCSFKVFKLRYTKRPSLEYDDFYKYAKLTKKKLNDQLILNYITACKQEGKINSKKMDYLKKIISLTWLALLSVVISGLLSLL